MAPIKKITADIIEKRGWRPGSSLEDQVTLQLSRAFTPEEVKQQHRVDRYRIDFAWPDVMVALEVDGWHHRSPEGAAKDAVRDSDLRHAGWLVLRVDDRHGEESMLDQVANVARLVWALRGRRAPLRPPWQR